jgi:hypothetical protein
MKDLSGKMRNVSIVSAVFVGNTIRLFDKQAKAVAKVESGLISTKNAAGLTFAELQKAATELQKKTLFGDEQILGGATSTLLTFTKITGKEFLKTQELTVDLAAKMGTDLQSAAIQVGKALNDPIANLGALGRAGIQFDETQKKLIKGFAESGQLQKAQAIILKELENQFGGTAAAMAAVGAGPLQQLSNAIGDANEMIGKESMSILKPFVDAIKAMTGAFSKSPPVVKKIVAVLAILVTVLTGLMAAISPLLVGFLALKFMAVSAGLAMGAALLPILAITAAVALLITAGVMLWKNWDGVVGGAKALWSDFSNLVVSIASRIGAAFTSIWESAKAGLVSFVNIGIDLINSLLAPLSFVAEKLGFGSVKIQSMTAPTAPTGGEGGRFNGELTVKAEAGTTVKRGRSRNRGASNIGMNMVTQ